MMSDRSSPSDFSAPCPSYLKMLLAPRAPRDNRDHRRRKIIKKGMLVVDEYHQASLVNVLLLFQLGNVKEARSLATEITEGGARLYELLGKEAEARPQRLRAVAFLEVSEQESALPLNAACVCLLQRNDQQVSNKLRERNPPLPQFFRAHRVQRIAVNASTSRRTTGQQTGRQMCSSFRQGEQDSVGVNSL